MTCDTACQLHFFTFHIEGGSRETLAIASQTVVLNPHCPAADHSSRLPCYTTPPKYTGEDGCVATVFRFYLWGNCGGDIYSARREW